jgi:hypothetical protein
LFAVHQEPPDEEGNGEQKGEGCIANVADSRCDNVDLDIRADWDQLHHCSDDSQRSKEGKDEAAFESRGVQESEELDMSDLYNMLAQE